MTPFVTHYREPFHQLLRAKLARADVSYEVISGQPHGADKLKGDTIALSWATNVDELRLGLLGRSLTLQPVFRELRGADMVILMQENKHLSNYIYYIFRRLMRCRVAVMGHGRNFQTRSPDSISERWKRYWATKVDWWFAYTEESRRTVERLGFPCDQITVFENAVDTTTASNTVQEISPDRLEARRSEAGLIGRNVCIYVGGMYPDKRLDFLLQASLEVREAVPDFELLVVGAGSELERFRQASDPYGWIKVLGPRFGKDKFELMALSKLFLMPGLVGLALLDAGAAGLPTITTAFPYHSPEIAYLQNGSNGLIVEDWENTQAYADAIVSLLKDDMRIAVMRAEASRTAARLTIENMAERFGDGILAALAHNRRVS